MGRIHRYLGVASLAVGASLVVAACAEKSPADKVAELRSFYSARLNGFLIEEEPMLPEMGGQEELEGQAAPQTEAVEEVAEPGAELEPMLDEVSVRQRVRLDILIQHRSNERLDGLTLDISMADSSGREKGHWRVWFDTSAVVKATVTQFTHILEDVGYEEGDGFFVEVRHPVPVEERSEYREFAGL